MISDKTFKNNKVPKIKIYTYRYIQLFKIHNINSVNNNNNINEFFKYIIHCFE